MNINPLDFGGKVALVTGAAAGMGLARRKRSLRQEPQLCWLISERTL